MYTTLTLICLQHCLYYAPYNGAATHGSPQGNLIILKCSQFIVPCWGIKLFALATARLSLLVIQVQCKLHLIYFDQLSNKHFLHLQSPLSSVNI